MPRGKYRISKDAKQPGRPWKVRTRLGGQLWFHTHADALHFVVTRINTMADDYR